MPRLSDYRFWLVLGTLAIALLAACSSSTTPDDAGGAPSSMTGG
jgi:uncharacterized lipoprotein